jgi:diketogulonate reductase-like aldo/keto reductase
MPCNVQELAAKYKKTPAQIALRWGVQRNTIVIPKSSKVERLKENRDFFDFELSEGDMQSLKQVDKKARTNNPKKFWGIDLFA